MGNRSVVEVLQFQRSVCTLLRSCGLYGSVVATSFLPARIPIPLFMLFLAHLRRFEHFQGFPIADHTRVFWMTLLEEQIGKRAEPGGGAVLLQTRNSGTMDQGRQTGGEDDAAEWQPIPFQRGAAVVESDRLQPRELVAAIGAAQRNRKLVADQLATAIAENRRPLGQARTILLAAASRESSDKAAVWKHGTAHLGTTAACGINNPPGRKKETSARR